MNQLFQGNCMHLQSPASYIFWKKRKPHVATAAAAAASSKPAPPLNRHLLTVCVACHPEPHQYWALTKPAGHRHT